MKINLNELYNKERIDIDTDITLTNIDPNLVKEIKNLHIKGYIRYTLSEEIEISLAVKGKMVILDAITLDEIPYDFAFPITEVYTENSPEFQKFIKNKQNILDINEILWENIVLEVPISKTLNSGLTMKGDGWELNGDSKK